MTRGRDLSAVIVGVVSFNLVRVFITVVRFRLTQTSAYVVTVVRLSSGIVMRRSCGRHDGPSHLRASAPMCECGAGGRQ